MVASDWGNEGSRHLRTAHVLQPTTGGAPVVALQLVEAEVAAGHDVIVAGPPELEGRVVALGATYRFLPLRRTPGLDDVRALLPVRRLVASVDVVVFHSSKAIMVGKFAMRLLPLSPPRSVALPHSWSWNVGGRLTPVYKVLERLTRHWVDVVVCVSEFEATQGREVLGDIPSVVIRNAVDVKRFQPPERSARSGSCRLLLVGRLSEQKGQDFFIPLMTAIDDATLTLVGDGASRPELEQLVRTLGLESRVTFFGEGDVVERYREADVVVMPSRWEGLSLVLLEAMACGRPVVASDAAAGDFGIDHGVVRVELSDKAFTAAVSQLVHDPSRREELGRRARTTAESVLALDQRNEQWLSLLALLVATGGPITDRQNFLSRVRTTVNSPLVGGRSAV
jgi:glycosyltransferase involved in cell wall biosynthesis